MNYTFCESNTQTNNLDQYARLLSLVFGKKKKLNSHYLEWLYERNPFGRVVGTDAIFEGEVVAHHAAIPVEYRFKDKIYKGLLALNNVTHPQHRRKNLLKQLGQSTFTRAGEIGYDFAITVTNKFSTTAYLSHFHFVQIGRLDVKIGYGHVGFNGKEDSTLRSFRTKDWWAWRLARPGAEYFQNKGMLFSKTHIPGIVAQMNFRHSHEQTFEHIRQNSPFAFTTWIGLAEEKKIKGVFVDLPDFLKPSPLHLLYKNLRGKMPAVEKKDLCFELIDFDAY